MEIKKIYAEEQGNDGVIVLYQEGIFRTKGNFYQSITNQNRVIESHKPTKEDQDRFLACMNSYLGMMKHYKTYMLRKKMIGALSESWNEHLQINKRFDKFVMKHKKKSTV